MLLAMDATFSEATDGKVRQTLVLGSCRAWWWGMLRYGEEPVSPCIALHRPVSWQCGFRRGTDVHIRVQLTSLWQRPRQFPLDPKRERHEYQSCCRGFTATGLCFESCALTVGNGGRAWWVYYRVNYVYFTQSRTVFHR